MQSEDSVTQQNQAGLAEIKVANSASSLVPPYVNPLANPVGSHSHFPAQYPAFPSQPPHNLPQGVLYGGWHSHGAAPPPRGPLIYPYGVTPPPGLVAPPFSSAMVAPPASDGSEWTEQLDASGRSYYHHSRTKVSTWIRPVGFVEKVRPKKPMPESWEAIPGTDWRKVTTTDKQLLYYNPKTKESSWTAPPSIAPILGIYPPSGVPPILAPPAPVSTATSSQNDTPPVVTSQSTHVVPQQPASADNTPSAAQPPDEQEWLPPEDEDFPPLPAVHDAPQVTKEMTFTAIKRKLEANEANSEIKRTRPEDAPPSPPATDSQAAQQQQKLDDSTEQFKQMLREKKVSSSSVWDKTLPQLVFDPRFKLLPTYSERRAVFDLFVRSAGEQERATKLQLAARHKELRTAYQHLLDEHYSSYDDFRDYSAFKKKFADHLAMKDAGGDGSSLTDADRSRMFDERRQLLKKQRHDETARKHERARARFEEHLIRRFIEQPKLEQDADWSRIRRVLDHDAPNDSSLAECLAELREGERESICRDLLRNRRHALRDQRNTVERTLERSRADARRAEAERNLRVAMQERCRAVDLTWKEARRLLDADPRLQDMPLTLDEQEAMFREHQTTMRESAAGDFRNLLHELTAHGELALNTEWDSLSKLLNAHDDVRYKRLSEKERASLFDRHLRDLRQSAQRDFISLLRDTKAVHADVPTEGKAFENLKATMKKDPRFMRLDCLEKERDALLIDFIKTQAPKKAHKDLASLIGAGQD